MSLDSETMLKTMVFNNYRDFCVVFEDPMFAFVFRTVNFNTQPSLIFCTVNRIFAGDLTIEKVDLKQSPCDEISRDPTQGLLEQLQTIKGLLLPETSPLRFSEICRELLVAKSNFMSDQAHDDNPDFCNVFTNFDVRYIDSFAIRNFQTLVGELSRFVFSNSLVKTYTTDDTGRKVISRFSDLGIKSLWVADDDFILVLHLPVSASKNMGDQFVVNRMASNYSDQGQLIFRTWNEMFADVSGAKCKNAGVVFLIIDDTIRFMYHRNLNAPFNIFKQGPSEPVIWYNSKRAVMGNYRLSKIEMTLKCFHQPFISDGINLRRMVKATVEGVDPQESILHTRTILYFCTAAIHLKNNYNLCQRMNYELHANPDMFQLCELDQMFRIWTGYICGQHQVQSSYKKFIHHRSAIYSFRLHGVLCLGLSKDREISWQFSDTRNRLSVSDSREHDEEILNEDLPGNALDLRAGIFDPAPKRLLRIDTGLL